MDKAHVLIRTVKTIAAIFGVGAMMGCVSASKSSWTEEVLLHDRRKVMVERMDTYDSNIRHEIGQPAPLSEHKTIFVIPDTNETVIWQTRLLGPSDTDGLYLLALDFSNGVPYVATAFGSCVRYNRFERPNPPYAYFKYVNGWQRISMREFPEEFKINVLTMAQKRYNPKIAEAERKHGFVPADTVAAINKVSGGPKEFYALFRTPINMSGVCPPRTGPDGLPLPENTSRSK